MKLQRCTICDEPTGRSDDDTIYSQVSDSPVCEDCDAALTSRRLLNLLGISTDAGILEPKEREAK